MRHARLWSRYAPSCITHFRGVFFSPATSSPRHFLVASQLNKPLRRWAIPRPQLGALQTRWMCAEAAKSPFDHSGSHKAAEAEPEEASAEMCSSSEAGDEASATRRGGVTLVSPAHEQRR